MLVMSGPNAKHTSTIRYIPYLYSAANNNQNMKAKFGHLENPLSTNIIIHSHVQEVRAPQRKLYSRVENINECGYQCSLLHIHIVLLISSTYEFGLSRKVSCFGNYVCLYTREVVC